MDTTQIMNIVYLVVGLVVLWIVLRIVLKLAARVFACGCSVIALVAIGLIVWNYLGKP